LILIRINGSLFVAYSSTAFILAGLLASFSTIISAVSPIELRRPVRTWADYRWLVRRTVQVIVVVHCRDEKNKTTMTWQINEKENNIARNGRQLWLSHVGDRFCEDDGIQANNTDQVSSRAPNKQTLGGESRSRSTTEYTQTLYSIDATDDRHPDTRRLNIRIPVAASARDTLLDPRPELVTYTASRHRH
jgi:hypothetical protein